MTQSALCRRPLASVPVVSFKVESGYTNLPEPPPLQVPEQRNKPSLFTGSTKSVGMPTTRTQALGASSPLLMQPGVMQLPHCH